MRPIMAPVSAASPASRAAIFGGTAGRLDPESDGASAGGVDDEASVAAMTFPLAGFGRTARQKSPAEASSTTIAAY